jgi:hypothetical protein
MTGILPKSTLKVSVRSASNPASTRPPDQVFETGSLKKRDGLYVYFSEETKLKKINVNHTFQKQSEIRPGKQALDEPAVYEFKVSRSLYEQWATWFDGLELVRDEQGNTLLSGTITDQAALHGVLAKIRDLNLILLSVMRK